MDPEIIKLNKQLCSCHCCGLIQKIPKIGEDCRLTCGRCRTPLRHVQEGRMGWTAALATAALILYPPAMFLPILRVERLGHVQESGLITGVYEMLLDGYWFVGIIVLLFSIILPLFKLIALYLLSLPRIISRSEDKALVYRAVECIGRWGMLDVMLVAILVAYVKLGSVVEINAGPGIFAFTAMVFLSLLASLSFNPLIMWDSPPVPE